MAHGRDTSSEAWRRILEEGDEFKRLRWIFKRLPSEPRCQMCHAPFRGFGGVLLRAVKGLGPSSLNPRYCNDCELIGADYPGGAEVDVAMLFADLRGSTSLAEQSTTWEYTAVIDRFYREAARVLIESDALIEKLIGDAVTAIFVGGLAGPQYVPVPSKLDAASSRSPAVRRPQATRSRSASVCTSGGHSSVQWVSRTVLQRLGPLAIPSTWRPGCPIAQRAARCWSAELSWWPPVSIRPLTRCAASTSRAEPSLWMPSCSRPPRARNAPREELLDPVTSRRFLHIDLSHHRSTRNARNVFHRLGRPTSSISNHVCPE